MTQKIIVVEIKDIPHENRFEWTVRFQGEPLAHADGSTATREDAYELAGRTIIAMGQVKRMLARR